VSGGYYPCPIYGDVEPLEGAFPKPRHYISLPDWWPGVAGLTERRLESWPILKSLAVGTVPPDDGAILVEIEVQGILLLASRYELGTYIPEHGMVFSKCPDPELRIQGFRTFGTAYLESIILE
jgi:hypothetical protein